MFCHSNVIFSLTAQRCLIACCTSYDDVILYFQVPESATSTPSSTLKGSQHAGGKTRGERKGVLTAEERKRLTFTLEEIERER